MRLLSIKIKKIIKDVEIPTYQTLNSSGIDISASEDVEIPPYKTKLIPTGLAFEIPQGYEMQLRPRSSTLLKWGLISSFGTIDADYRGEVKGILYNPKPEPVTIKKGQRFIQGIFCKIEMAGLIEVNELTPTERGEGGFGSTGVGK